MHRKSLAGLFTAGFIVSSVGAATAAPMVAKAATQSVLRIGSHGAAVTALQNQLNKLGFSCGTADGAFGPRTLAAVIAFQRSKHLATDGVVGPNTQGALNGSQASSTGAAESSGGTNSGAASSTISSETKSASPGITATPTISIGAHGTAVQTLQTVLNALGFSCGTADGDFGPKTASAVQAFQRASKLTPDGVVGPNTWAAVKHGLTATGAASAPSSRGSSLASSSGSANRGSSTSTNSSAPAYPGSIVQMGSKGTSVVEVQTKLNQLGFSCGIADGDFGPKTDAEVKLFQQSKHLTTDGQIGPQTWDALFGTTTPSSAQSSGSGSAYQNVDLRYSAPTNISVSSVDNFLRSNGSPLTGLGESFLLAQTTYSVDATYLVAHAIEETAYGTSQIAQNKNNLFGYGAYDANPGNDAGMFPSDDYAIRFEAWEVRNSYLDPNGNNYGGSATLTGMNKHYATDPSWSANIGNIMSQIASSVGGNVNEYTTYAPGNQAPAPSTTVEPVYYLNGAAGTTLTNAVYGGVPYYASLADGETDKFAGSLQNGSYGSGAALVQKYLNAVDGAGLIVDGAYGKNTMNAVKVFEQKQGLAQDGVWSAAMWTHYIQNNKAYQAAVIPSGQAVQIDNIAQGMVGGLVVPWYHVKGYGWVASTEVQLNNTYRLMTPSSETSSSVSIPVYASDGSTQIATLHAGDFVVAASPNATNGLYTIQFAAQTSGASFGSHPAGTLMTGTVKTASARLVQQH